MEQNTLMLKFRFLVNLLQNGFKEVFLWFFRTVFVCISWWIYCIVFNVLALRDMAQEVRRRYDKILCNTNILLPIPIPFFVVVNACLQFGPPNRDFMLSYTKHIISIRLKRNWNLFKAYLICGLSIRHTCNYVYFLIKSSCINILHLVISKHNHHKSES